MRHSNTEETLDPVGFTMKSTKENDGHEGDGGADRDHLPFMILVPLHALHGNNSHSMNRGY